jgi:imidazole glycerol-phosphate synthase subunit HisH
MSDLIGIVNYGIAGNIFSIKKAIERAGGNVFIIERPSDFQRADKIVVPGVGSFNDAMQELETSGLIEPIKLYKKPILGICLGMQILSTLGYEYGKTQALGLIDAEVKQVLCDLKVPHMGFNSIDVVNTNKLLNGLESKEFYFMHSYEVVNYLDIASLTTYGGHSFVSSIQKNNIYGVQFHPEKSRVQGIKLFENFLKL